MQWRLHEFLKWEKDDGSGGQGGGQGGGEGGEGGAGGESGAGGHDGAASGTGEQGSGGGDAGSGEAHGGASGQDWRTGITDEYLRGNPALKDIPDLTTLAKNHVELQSHLGNAIRVPGPDAGPEAISDFHKRLMEKVPGLMMKPQADNPDALGVIYDQLGRPEAPDKYTIPNLGDGVDHTMTEQFRAVAHKHGLSQVQFEGIVKDITQANLKGAEDHKATHDAAILKLKEEDWGVAFDDNMKLCLNVAEQTGAPPELIQAIRSNQATPATLKWLVKIGKQAGEGLNLTVDNSTGDGRLTPQEANARISEIMNNRDHAYWKPFDPGHKDALNRMLDLQKMANPQASTNLNDLRAGGGGRHQA